MEWAAEVMHLLYLIVMGFILSKIYPYVGYLGARRLAI
jgi:hypothetical protein